MRLHVASFALDRRAPFIALFGLIAALLAIAAPPARAAVGAPASTANLATAAAAPSISDGMAGYWPFDEGSGTTSTDYAGGNNATLHSPAGFTNITPTLDQANPSAFRSVIDPNSYASAPGNGIDNLQQLTVAFWVRLDPNPQLSERHLITLGNNKLAIRYILTPYSGNLYFDITIDHIQRTMAFSPYTLTPGAYYHIAFTFDGTNMHPYVNGASMGIFDTPGTVATGNGIRFGDPTYPLDGELDDVRIYNRALSGTEIARLAFHCSGVGEIPPAECNALADLYLSTNGASWKNSTSWLRTNTPCSWYGILCANGHVFLIGLPNNNLSGTLPLSLNDLTGLNSLGLNDNNLTGPIPPLLSGLTQLQTLDLSRNHLSGGLPALLGSLTHLRGLLLSANALSGDVATSITRLTALTTLNVSYNALNPTDSGVRAFFTSHQPDWAATQTVPPSNLQAQMQSSTGVALTWTPIQYTADAGYYEVFASKGDGLYTSMGKTSDKAASGITITGLQAGLTYSFLVRTFTPKHGAQLNDVTSDTTDAITAMPVNQSPARITIVLDSQPDSKTNFKFTGSLATFYLDDITPQDADAYSSSKSFSVPAGVYTVTQALPSGWMNANISCSPPANTIADLTKNQIVIRAAAGATVTCTFVTQRLGQIVAGAYNDHNRNHVRDANDEWLSGWQMQLSDSRSPQVALKATDQNGRATFGNLRPGDYTVCEVLFAGWTNITPGALDPRYGQPCYTVTVDPGKSVWARFGNSPAPLATAAARATAAAPVQDIIVCDLPATDDAGSPVGPAYDPWEAQEEAAASHPVYISLAVR